MPGRISMMAFAATEFRVNQTDISLYVSLSNELGIGATGYTKEHFKLQLLHPLNIKVEGKSFIQKAEMVAVNDLKNGYYEVVCRNNTGWPNHVILGVSLKKMTGGMGSDSGQTLVSFVLN